MRIALSLILTIYFYLHTIAQINGGSHLSQIKDNFPRVILVEVVKTYKTDEELYIMGEVEDQIIVIEAGERNFYKFDNVAYFPSLNEQKMMPAGKYAIVLKPCNITNLRKICKELGIKYSKKIKCYKTNTINKQGKVFYITINDFNIDD